MRGKTGDIFTTIRTEGALLPVDLLQRILAGDKGLPGLTPEDYHLSGEKVIDIDDVDHIGPPQLAGVGHLHFAVDSISGQDNGFYFFHVLPSPQSNQRRPGGFLSEFRGSIFFLFGRK